MIKNEMESQWHVVEIQDGPAIVQGLEAINVKRWLNNKTVISRLVKSCLLTYLDLHSNLRPWVCNVAVS